MTYAKVKIVVKEATKNQWITTKAFLNHLSIASIRTSKLRLEQTLQEAGLQGHPPRRTPESS